MRFLSIQFLKAQNVAGLSWLTQLYSIMWHSGVVPLDYQTAVVVTIFRMGYRRVNYREIILFSLPGTVYGRVLERNVNPSFEPQIKGKQCDFCSLVAEHLISSLSSQGYIRLCVNLPNHSTCVLLIWRRHSIWSHGVSCGRSMGSMGCLACCY